MIRFDEFTFSLPRLWIAVCLLLVLDFITLGSSGFGNQIALRLMHLLPRPVGGAMFLVGPFVVGALWLVIFVLGVVFHGGRGRWLALPGLIILPATYLQLIVWACAVHGQCP